MERRATEPCLPSTVDCRDPTGTHHAVGAGGQAGGLHPNPAVL